MLGLHKITSSFSGMAMKEEGHQWRTERGFGVFKSPEIPKALQNRAKLNPIVKTVKNS